MNAISGSADNGSKRWLVVLGVTVAASVVFLAYSFVKTLSPPEPSVVAPQKSPTTTTEEAVVRTEPDWNAAHVGQGSPAATTRVDPFAAQEAATARAAAGSNPIEREKAVHQQADYLRTMISQGKLPEGYGNLTKEQVDDIEKRGLLFQ